MSMMLLLGNPDAYVDFCKQYPVDLRNSLAHETNIGGAADIMSPTPAVYEFFKFFETRKGELPTQAEYVEHCFNLPAWAAWLKPYPEYVKECYRARLYRNFYPAFIDSLHVWALLGTRYYTNGKLVFDRCILDTNEDVVNSKDLLVYRGKQAISIALVNDTLAARRAYERKQRFRGAKKADVTLWLPIRPQARVGGKCWYAWPNDFEQLFQKAEQLRLPYRDEGA